MRISNLKKRLNAEQNISYYTCKKQCIRTTLERALESDFTCLECEKVMHEVDNSKKVKLIKEELSFLEQPEELAEALIEETNTAEAEA